MHPVLLQIGPFTLATYTALVDLGIAIALGALYWRAPEGKAGRWLDIGIAAAVGGLIGARLIYVGFNADYYLAHLEEVVQVWQGGLSWTGAAFGALAGAWIATRAGRRHEALGPVLDTLALPIALLGLLGWTGCLAAGCSYGFEVAPGQLPAWFTSQAPDLYGLIVPRFPTQALGIAWSIVALAAVWAATRGKGQGWPAGAYGLYALSLVALGMFGLSFTRGDAAPLIGGYRLDTAGSALVLLTATGLWASRLVRRSSAAVTASNEAATPATSATHAGETATPADSSMTPT